MNKSEMIVALAEKTGYTRKEVETIIESLNQMTIEKLSEGEKVAFSGFGSFEVRVRAAHVGRDPRTGVPIDVPETRSVAFHAGKILKESISK